MHEASGWTPAPDERGLSDSYQRLIARGPKGPLPAAVTCGVFSLFFLVEAFEPFSVFRLVLGIATAALTVRLAIRGTLVAGKDCIKWHTVMRTWRWPYSTVDHFELAVRSRASGPQPRVMLIHLTDGRARWLGALQELPGGERDPRPVRLPTSSAGGRLTSLWPPPQPLEEVVSQLNLILTEVHDSRDAREAS